jgi:hypothetical protein
MGREAEELKLDEDAGFQEMLRFSRLQLLERQLVRYLEKESSAISQAEIEEYYRRNPGRFEEGSLHKIYIPKQGKWSTLEAADTIRQRAAKGEDFDALQREVWTSQGRLAGTPLTHTGALRRSTLPASQQSAFDLQPGEVSKPIEEPDGYSIFGMESKRVLPLSAVAGEIRTTLSGERLQARIREIRSVTVSVNEEYFGALPATEELASHHGLQHEGSHLIPMSESERAPR